MATEIRVVMFDQGGVLTKGGGPGTNEAVAARHMGLEEIKAPKIVDALKRGWITNSDYVEQINWLYPDAPRPLTNDMWDEVYATLVLEPRAMEFVGRCRDAGLVTGLLSNISLGMAIRLRRDGAYEGFYPLVLSCDTHYAKPEPPVYLAVEGALSEDINPRQILLLDDQQKCVDGALQRGWQGAVIPSPDDLARIAGPLLGL